MPESRALFFSLGAERLVPHSLFKRIHRRRIRRNCRRLGLFIFVPPKRWFRLERRMVINCAHSFQLLSVHRLWGTELTQRFPREKMPLEGAEGEYL